MVAGRTGSGTSFDELYAEIQRLPEGMTGEILEPGVLRTMSRPGRAHARASKHLARALGGFDRELGGSGWWILVEAEVRMPENRLFVPDLAGWRVQRVPELPRENPISVIPDWTCEILSPGNAREDRLVKLPRYIMAGVEWVWLVSPEQRAIEVYGGADGRPVLITSGRDDETPVLPPFDIAMDLGPWWTDEPA